MKPGYKLIGLGPIIFAAHSYHKKEIDRYEHDLRQNRITYESLLTAQEMRLRDYFTAAGSTQPATVAKAVSKSKRKYLAAATARKESNGNPAAIGDGGQSRGLYQIQPKHWGPVPKNPELQTAKHDWVVDQLEKEVGMPLAVERYNGSSPSA